MVIVSKIEQFVTLLFRRLAERQSVLSLESILMAVFDLTTTHRSRQRRICVNHNQSGEMLKTLVGLSKKLREVVGK
jgi:hypothetical protein